MWSAAGSCITEQLVREWIDKAEEDWEAVQQLLAGRAASVPDVIGYLAHQTAEKYLKAVLVLLGQEPARVHDIGALLDRCAENRVSLENLRDDTESLNPLGVRFRYPGNSLTLEQAREGVACAQRIRNAARAILESDASG